MIFQSTFRRKKPFSKNTSPFCTPNEPAAFYLPFGSFTQWINKTFTPSKPAASSRASPGSNTSTATLEPGHLTLCRNAESSQLHFSSTCNSLTPDTCCLPGSRSNSSSPERERSCGESTKKSRGWGRGLRHALGAATSVHFPLPSVSPYSQDPQTCWFQHST